MDTINVSILKQDIIDFASAKDDIYIISRLREAKIPVKGLFIFRGVSHGKLISWEDYNKNTINFKWSNN